MFLRCASVQHIEKEDHPLSSPAYADAESCLQRMERRFFALSEMWELATENIPASSRKSQAARFGMRSAG
jgi:hypothetical protein